MEHEWALSLHIAVTLPATAAWGSIHVRNAASSSVLDRTRTPAVLPRACMGCWEHHLR